METPRLTTKTEKPETPKTARKPKAKPEGKAMSTPKEAPKPRRVTRAEKSLEPDFSIERLQFLIVDALEDMKGQSISVFNTEGLSDLFDRVVIASGTSNRQTRALANSVVENVKKNGGSIYGLEGEDTGEWVLVDCGDIIVHILQPAIRAHFRLEEIWGADELSLDEVKKRGQKVRRPGPRSKRESAETPAKKTARKKSDTNPQNA
jgi:ribosome silencing factor RsfS/YbeB/iojap